jgi:hypothetical protein
VAVKYLRRFAVPRSDSALSEQSDQAHPHIEGGEQQAGAGNV